MQTQILPRSLSKELTQTLLLLAMTSLTVFAYIGLALVLVGAVR